MKVQTLLCVLIWSLVVSCNLSCRNSGADQSILGTWEIVHMSKSPVPVDNLPASKLASGRMEFKGDGTFEGQVSMPGVPEGTPMSGTYQVEGDVITLNNSQNKSTTKSKVRFEKDYVVLKPLTPGPFSYSMYYKRVK